MPRKRYSKAWRRMVDCLCRSGFQTLVLTWPKSIQRATATYLSGAGPTIMLILEDSDHDAVPELEEKLSSLKHHWALRQLRIEWHGARVLRN